MPISTPSDGGRALGRLLLGVGLVVLSVGFVLCGYSVIAGFETGEGSGGGGLDTGLTVAGVVGIAGGALVIAVGALVTNTVRRPRSSGIYGAYPEMGTDDDGGDPARRPVVR